MKIRLGYVAIAKKLGKKITSSSTVTFTNYNKISTSEKKLEKLKAVSASNLKNLGKILNYNIENNICQWNSDFIVEHIQTFEKLWLREFDCTSFCFLAYFYKK